MIHACWSGGGLRLFAEELSRFGATPTPSAERTHPFALSAGSLAELLGGAGVSRRLTEAQAVLKLPAAGGKPLPSPRAALALGHPATGADGVGTFEVPTVVVPAGEVEATLDALVDASEQEHATFAIGKSVEFFAACSRMAGHLLAQERFVPMLCQQASGELTAMWAPWTSDEATAERLSLLISSMPPAARAGVDDLGHDPALVVREFLTREIDALARQTLKREDMIGALGERSPQGDAQVGWLSGLLGDATSVPSTSASRQDTIRRVRTWVAGLDDRGVSSAWRLCLRLSEPIPDTLPGGAGPGASGGENDAEWAISFHLQSVDRPTLLIDAEDIWLLPGQHLTVEGKRVDAPQELLLKELGRASRLYRVLEGALEDAQPSSIDLTTKQAYDFLREQRPILIEQGFGVIVPEWWDSPMARLGARLRVESDPTLPGGPASAGSSTAATPKLGMGALVKYRWEIALGDTSLTLNEFEQLAAKKTPLVRVNGRWVEVRPEDVQAAIRFIRENPGGEMRVADALRMAYGTDLKQTGIPVVGLEATGWVAAMLNGQAGQGIEILDTPRSFRGTLRPYQVRGLSWLCFLERLGLGACLADDMGLGKTIQLLALLALERQAAEGQLAVGDSSPKVLPTLLVAPMSVVGNWLQETRRFCPELRVLVHHGLERQSGQELVDAAQQSDLVVTTYSLAHRDKEVLGKVSWGRIVLDEAQYIKNPMAKQSQAVRGFVAERRVALTGTPVENRLSELWSVMDFLNPGYLGSAHTFRTRFAVPIERYRDKSCADQLRGLVRPFVLRRLKSDPTVVADLPEKLETRDYCHLTSEQASLYETCVRRMLTEVDNAEGIHRRGLVLAALIKLKQICNHPGQLLKDHEASEGRPARQIEPERSGKCVRLLELLDEVLAEGEQALVFTQFRQMGAMLSTMIQARFDREVLFLHGGTTQAQRQEIIETFQKADGSKPVLVLSLRAGGVGLNLTAATHVFHFDRWWNPAVENQATDRAYRIGQTRTVQVHKFVVKGTLEERIDEMIEQKTELAENIIGGGERWLTELSTDQLRDVLTLRQDAIVEE